MWQEDSGLWEVSAEVGKDRQPHTALHSALIIADQMNVRSGESAISATSDALLPYIALLKRVAFS